MRRPRLKTNAVNIVGLLALLACALPLAVPAALLAEEPKPKKEEKPIGDAAPAKDEGDKDAAKEEEEEEKEEEEKDRFFAVTGAVIHTVTEGDIAGATILAKNGKIQRIGRDIVLPEETETLDATGYHLYPGFVAPYTFLGLTEIGNPSMPMSKSGVVSTCWPMRNVT